MSRYLKMFLRFGTTDLVLLKGSSSNRSMSKSIVPIRLVEPSGIMQIVSALPCIVGICQVFGCCYVSVGGL